MLRELAVDNKRTEKFLEFCCTDEWKYSTGTRNVNGAWL